MALNRLPGAASLYIGGLLCLQRKDALKKAHITHIVSVFRPPLPQGLPAQFKHLLVEVDDLVDEDIIQHFATSNAFIQEGLDEGGGVLVHCVMGRSRSTTLLIAYLLTRNTSPDPSSALALIQQCRPMAMPNLGFMSQLHLYHAMHHPAAPTAHPAYQLWLYHRKLDASRACGRAPDSIRFSDEVDASPEDIATYRQWQAADTSTPDLKELDPKESDPLPDTITLPTPPSPSSDNVLALPSLSQPPLSSIRCRRCRTPLATSTYLLPHRPLLSSHSTPPSSSSSSPPQCAHLFLEPLSWMRPELDQGLMSGRLECPNGKCSAQVGKYAWQGMRCSCGGWVVPAVCVARGRVDFVGG